VLKIGKNIQATGGPGVLKFYFHDYILDNLQYLGRFGVVK